MNRFLGRARPRGGPDAFAARLRDVLVEGSLIERLINTTSMAMDGVMDVGECPFLVQGLSIDD